MRNTVFKNNRHSIRKQKNTIEENKENEAKTSIVCLIWVYTQF